MFPYIIQGNSITIVVDGKPHTISNSHITYEQVKAAIRDNDWQKVRDIIDPKEVVVKFAEGFVRIDGDEFLWMGKPMHNALSTKMVQMLKDGFPITPLVRFMERLMENPSKRAVDELYGFLEKGNLPITPDGYFLAYKKVRDNYTDCHTGTMDNSVGKVVQMARNEVDDDKDRTCSAGLHFCSQEYLSHFGGARTVILKINPKDVVSIPSDYNDSKGRACRYEVIGELAVEPEKAFVKSVQETAVGSQPVKTAQTGPKKGTSAFYRGYTDAYTVHTNNSGLYRSPKDRQDYNEGFDKGAQDERRCYPARYEYDAPAVLAATTTGQRQLSMTKDAIRKREARAKAKAARVAAGKVVAAPYTGTGSWPHPKGFKS